MPDASSLPRVVGTGEFEGPLDLLLDEVRREKIPVEKIALAPLVARFLEYVRSARARNLNLDMEWLHMAATLIYWKSRSLLPSDPAVPAADPVRDELVGQLLARRRELARDLGQRRVVEDRRLSRPADPAAAEAEEADPAAFVSVWDLIGQARDLERWARAARADRRQWQETFEAGGEEATVSGMMKLLAERLTAAAGRPLDGRRLLEEQSPARRCCLFLGMLEMAQGRQLEIEQAGTFGAVSLSAVRTAGLADVAGLTTNDPDLGRFRRRDLYRRDDARS
jgi:chromatin segregation and condensation protein Rec8/ScpA/Scc1 (kleisin family)